MASTSGGVLADVQRQLAAGWSDEEILTALTAKGLSQTSAERFLQRARPAAAAPPPVPFVPPVPPEAPVLYESAAPSFTEVAPPPLPMDAPTVVFGALPPVPFDGPPPIPSGATPPVPGSVPPPMRFHTPPPPPPVAPRALATASGDAPEAPGTGSRLGVIGGSVVMTLGLVVLAWALGQERVRIRLPLALTFGGATWMLSAARGLIDLRRPATWVLPGSAAAPPALAALAVLGAVLTTGAPRTPPADPADAAGVAERRASAPRRAKETRDAAIAKHVERLQGTSTGDPCQAAFALAQLGAREQVPNLLIFLDEATEDDRKICAAYALVRLGEGSAMLPRYVEWSQAESEQLVHGAIVGFGHVGPSAAHEAVPVLQDALAGQPSAARRWVIVSTLAKLGPAAAPALQLVVDDEDAQVRTAAQKALEKLR